jgi:hypothetical protein
VYLQRVTGSGTIAAGWPLEGLAVCALPAYQSPTAIASDGLGGALVVWHDFRNAGSGGTGQDVYAQRILPDGTIAPGWAPGGMPVSRAPDYQNLPVVVADGAGGHLLRLDDGARLAPGMYWLRLTQLGRALVTRGVVVR